MAKPKRMSEILVSSSENDGDITMAAVPPYSSDGPTIPMIGASEDQDIGNRIPETITGGNANDSQAENEEEKKKETGSAMNQSSQSRSPPSNDPALYQPWSLLPLELLNRLEFSRRLRKSNNIIPMVISKSQNIKTAVSRLQSYLEFNENTSSKFELPDALNLEDCVIAVSAEGMVTTKLIGIVDMARRFAASSGEKQTSNKKARRWWLYTILTNIEKNSKLPPRKLETREEQARDNTTQRLQEDCPEPSASENLKDRANESERSLEETNHRHRVPVLTVWMTRQQIPAFRDAFGEDWFMTQGSQLAP